MIPPPVTVGLMVVALSDFVGSKMENFSHTFTGPGFASRAARLSLRAFSFALQLPKKLFQGVNSFGKYCEAQANQSKIFSLPLQAIGFTLQFPSKVVKAISSVFAGQTQPAADNNIDASPVSKESKGKKDASERSVKTGVKDNVREQEAEMTTESVHLAVRSTGGEVVASFFDVLSSFKDLRRYFSQKSQKHHIADMMNIVHKEMHFAPVSPKVSMDTMSRAISDSSDLAQSHKDKAVVPLKTATEKVSSTNITYDLSQMKKIAERDRSGYTKGSQWEKSRTDMQVTVASSKDSVVRTENSKKTYSAPGDSNGAGIYKRHQ